jgi:hypothetical protein
VSVIRVDLVQQPAELCAVDLNPIAHRVRGKPRGLVQIPLSQVRRWQLGPRGDSEPAHLSIGTKRDFAPTILLQSCQLYGFH